MSAYQSIKKFFSLHHPSKPNPILTERKEYVCPKDGWKLTVTNNGYFHLCPKCGGHYPSYVFKK